MDEGGGDIRVLNVLIFNQGGGPIDVYSLTFYFCMTKIFHK